MIQPQVGFQTKALSTSADIAILGGGAGMGKSFVLLMESTRYTPLKGFFGGIFRRTMPQITNQGALLDQSKKLYPVIGGVLNKTDKLWKFQDKSSIKLGHLQYDDTVLDHQGTEYGFIGFDELTHFSEYQFEYMMSRLRSVAGINPYVRATCNPDADSWVAKFIEWWIDQETGYPIKERDGVVRYYTKVLDQRFWADSREELFETLRHNDDFQAEMENAIKAGININSLVKSATFVGGSIYDNKILLSSNPQYLGSLMSLNEVEKKQLLHGNWKVSQDGLHLFEYEAVRNIDSNHPIPSSFRCITADVARFGRDWTVIFVWQGWEVVKIVVYFVNDERDVFNSIEAERQKWNIPVTQVLVDQDGVGGNVVKLGKYRGFSGGASAQYDPSSKTDDMYFNLKTQCAYRVAEENVNQNKLSVRLGDSMVEVHSDKGVRTFNRKIKRGPNVKDVVDYIRDDLRAMKRIERTNDGKLKMNDKEDQKSILGRSPDFGDNIIMRKWFDVMRIDRGVRY